ncbi:right-handed parallel beta-helix repeat-containing protein [Thermosynechococcus sp. FA-CM-4201]
MTTISDILRQQLQKDSSLLNRPTQLQALLKDLCHQLPSWQVNTVILAQKQGIPTKLLQDSQSDPALLVGRLTQLLMNELGLQEEVARLGVSAWAFALGISGPVSTDRSISVTPSQPKLTSTQTTQVTVAPYGSADYRSIHEALASVSAGSTIIVKPGQYHESLVLNKPVEIIGDGAVEEIILVAENRACILMQTTNARVANLTLRTTSDGEKACVDIQKGRLVLEDCDIQSNSSVGVIIKNSGTNPVIRRCHIHESKSAGIFINAGASGVIEDCKIWGNAGAGVEIRDTNSNPIIRRCQIYDNQDNGILIWLDASGVIEDCKIWGNVGKGVDISFAVGNPTIRRCEIHDNQDDGICIDDEGFMIIDDEGFMTEDCVLFSSVVIEDCKIFGNRLEGIRVNSENCKPIIRRCQIQ